MIITFEGKWTPLAIPNKLCDYINDHAIFIDINNKLKLLGTSGTHPYRLHKETQLVEFSGNSDDFELLTENRLLFNKFPTILPKYSPFVFIDIKNHTFHLYFSSVGKIYHLISKSGTDWEFINIAIKSSLPFLRDPFVIEYDGRYLMYVTQFGNKVSIYESLDLTNFEYLNDAFSIESGLPKSLNSSCESPTVLKLGGEYLLFMTIVPSPFRRKRNYNKTYVFSSKNILDFGLFSELGSNTSKLVCILEAHAPEIFIHNGEYFMTTCGWSGYPKPTGLTATDNGVYYKKIKFN